MAVGGVFEQQIDGRWQPLAFFSHQLRAPERNYSAFDRELLALYMAIQHFCNFLQGRSFTVYTDHKPLTFTLGKMSDPWSTRQQRHLAFISEFTTDVQHDAGKNKSPTLCPVPRFQSSWPWATAWTTRNWPRRNTWTLGWHSTTLLSLS